jgi:hypothetical protein
MRNLFTLSFFIFFVQLHAQQKTFTKVFYDSLNNWVTGNAIAAGADSGYMIAADGLIIKMDALFQLQWNKTVSNMHFNAIISTYDSCYVLGGYTYINNHNEAACLKVDAKGNILWTRVINGSHDLFIYSIAQDKDSGFVMTGSSEGGSPNRNVFAAKLDKYGNKVWSEILKETSYWNTGYSIQLAPDSGYIITGGTDGLFLLRLSSSGVVLWSGKYNTINPNVGNGNALIAEDDGYLIYFRVNYDNMILKTDLSGNIKWCRKYQNAGTSFFNILTKPKITKAGNKSYVFTFGNCEPSQSRATKIDSSGKIVWNKVLFLAGLDVIENSQKQFVILGNGPLCGVAPNGFDDRQIGLIVTDSNGNADDCVMDDPDSAVNTTLVYANAVFTSANDGIQDSVSVVTGSRLLAERISCVAVIGGMNKGGISESVNVTPNPSNGYFKIGLAPGAVQLQVYNALGWLVYKSEINSRESEIDLKGQPAGIYFYQVNFNKGQKASGKLIISR